MAEKKIENLSREQLLEALCVDGKNADSFADEYNMDKRAVQEYLYNQGFTKNLIKRESLIFLRGVLYEEANLDAKEDLISHSGSFITDAIASYLSDALRKSEKGEKPKQVLQRMISPLINSLLKEEWLKLLLFVENQPMPDSILRYPPEGYLNQLLQEYAASLPSGYKITKDFSITKKQKSYIQRENPHKKSIDSPIGAKKEETIVVQEKEKTADIEPQLLNAELITIEDSNSASSNSFVEKNTTIIECDKLTKVPDVCEAATGQTNDFVSNPQAQTEEKTEILSNKSNTTISNSKKNDLSSQVPQKEHVSIMPGQQSKGFLSHDKGKDVRKRPIMGDSLLKA